MIAELFVSAVVMVLGVAAFVRELRTCPAELLEAADRRQLRELELAIAAERAGRPVAAAELLEVTEPEPGVVCIKIRDRPRQPNIMAIIDPPSSSSERSLGQDLRALRLWRGGPTPNLHKNSPRFRGSERA